MSQLEEIMQNILTVLTETVPPGRTVTRTFRDFGNRPDEQLLGGVYTVMSMGVRDYDNLRGQRPRGGVHQVLILGQMLMSGEYPGDGIPGDVIEQAEFTMKNEINDFVNAYGVRRVGGGLKVVEFTQSGQLENPYCWVQITLNRMGGD